MPKPKTNVQILTGIMNYSNFGPIVQAFIMNAVYSAAEATAETDPKDLPQTGFVSPEVWVGVAKEIKGKLDEQWGRK